MPKCDEVPDCNNKSFQATSNLNQDNAKPRLFEWSPLGPYDHLSQLNTLNSTKHSIGKSIKPCIKHYIKNFILIFLIISLRKKNLEMHNPLEIEFHSNKSMELLK